MNKILLTGLLFLALGTCQAYTQTTEEANDSPVEQQTVADKRRAIKVATFAPLFHAISLGYEHGLKSNVSLDIQLCHIDTNEPEGGMFDKISGGYGAIGIKYVFDWDKSRSKRVPHSWDGIFVMPQLIVSYIERENQINIRNFSSNTQESFDVWHTTLYGALIFNVGVQHVYRNRLLIQAYMGIGFGVNDNTTRTNRVGQTFSSNFTPNQSHAISHMQYNRAAMRLCFNLGWCF